MQLHLPIGDDVGAKPRPLVECDCGTETRRASGVCDGCLYLDGGPGSPGRIVSALRTLGCSATVYQIADEAGMSARNVIKHVKGLIEEGRVMRFVNAPDGQFTGGWLYRLVMR